MLPQVIRVGAIDDGIETALPGDVMEPSPELRLAEVAAIGGVGQVSRILELVSIDFEDGNIEPLCQLDRCVGLNRGIGGAAPRHREEIVAPQGLAGRNGQQSGVHPPGVAEQDATHR